MKERYKLELLFSNLHTRIVHGFASKTEAIEYADMEGDHVLEYKVEIDDLAK